MPGCPAKVPPLAEILSEGGDVPNMARFRHPSCHVAFIASLKQPYDVDRKMPQRLAGNVRAIRTACIFDGSAMTVLDDVKPGTTIRGVVPGHSVRIVSVEWIGNQAINLVYRGPDDRVSETTLYRDDENRLSIKAHGWNW